jgi:hypothetical protein
MRTLYRFRFAAFGVAFLISLIVVVGIVALRPSSAKTAKLPYVTDSDFASANLTILASDGSSARVSEEQASSKVIGDDKSQVVIDVRLVELSGGGRFRDVLAWAVSLDPTVNEPPPLTGDVGFVPSPRKTKFSIVFISADTGEELFRWAQYEPIDKSAEPTP